MRRTPSIFIIVSLILLGSAVFLLFPGQSSIREKRAAQVLINRVDQVSQIDLLLLKSTNQYIVPAAGQSRGDLYLFMPSINNHPALVYNPKNNDFLKNDFRDLTIHVIPLPVSDSPLATKVLKLALNSPGPDGQKCIDLMATDDDKEIEKRWNALSPAIQKSLNDKLDFNQKISEGLGKCQAFLTFKHVAVKTDRWSDFLPIMGDFHIELDKKLRR